MIFWITQKELDRNKIQKMKCLVGNTPTSNYHVRSMTEAKFWDTLIHSQCTRVWSTVTRKALRTHWGYSLPGGERKSAPKHSCPSWQTVQRLTTWYAILCLDFLSFKLAPNIRAHKIHIYKYEGFIVDSISMKPTSISNHVQNTSSTINFLHLNGNRLRPYYKSITIETVALFAK